MSNLPVSNNPLSLNLNLDLPPKPLNLDNFKGLSKRVAYAENLLRYHEILLNAKRDIDKYAYSHPDFYTKIEYCTIDLTTDPNVIQGLKNQGSQLKVLIRTAMVQIIDIQLASVEEDLRALNVGF